MSNPAEENNKYLLDGRKDKVDIIRAVHWKAIKMMFPKWADDKCKEHAQRLSVKVNSISH